MNRRMLPLVVLAAFVGCEHTGSRCGFRFEVVKPPVLYTSTPIDTTHQAAASTTVTPSIVPGPKSGPTLLLMPQGKMPVGPSTIDGKETATPLFCPVWVPPCQ